MIRLCFLMVVLSMAATAVSSASPFASAAFELGGHRVERLGDRDVEAGRRQGDVLRRADGAELELVAGEGERRRAVAIAGIARQLRQRADADVEHAAGLGALGAAAASTCSKMSVSMSPRNTERIAGGASLAPRR